MAIYGTRQTIAHQKECLPPGAVYLRKVDNNTIEFLTKTGEHAWMLHETVIAVANQGGSGICLFAGGFKTPTTKDRLNKALHRFGCQTWGIYQEAGHWYLFCHDNDMLGGRWLFYEGITLEIVCGAWRITSSTAAGLAEKSRENHLLKLIDKYCKVIAALDALPVPDPGDCWSCLFGMGTDCLEDHLKHQYIHGSVIVQALAAKGYVDPAFIFQLDRKPWPLVTRALRSYFKKNLGLVV